MPDVICRARRSREDSADPRARSRWSAGRGARRARAGRLAASGTPRDQRLRLDLELRSRCRSGRRTCTRTAYRSTSTRTAPRPAARTTWHSRSTSPRPTRHSATAPTRSTPAGAEHPYVGYSYVPDTAGGTAFMYHLDVGGHLITNLRLSGDDDHEDLHRADHQLGQPGRSPRTTAPSCRTSRSSR